MDHIGITQRALKKLCGHSLHSLQEMQNLTLAQGGSLNQ